MKGINGLVISVGGAPAPITASLEKTKPDFVLFVVSSGSRPQVEEQILPALSGDLPQWECLIVNDHEDIGGCYAEIRRELADWLRRRDLRDEQVAADFTGATKPMSAALALVAVERFSTLCYVGGAIRDKRNLGVVVDGSERLYSVRNPWNKYAVRELERAAALLREFHADLAAEVLERASGLCDGSMASRLSVFSWLVRAFAAADRFDFKDAMDSYRRCQSRFPLVIDDARRESVEREFHRWETLRSQTKHNDRTPGRETILELVANANRRSHQYRYDDAVGRLYRAVELHMQGLARDHFGDELGRLQIRSLPEARQHWIRAEFGEPDDGGYKLGIEKLFRVLEHCGCLRPEQVGGYARLKPHLRRRNASLLAHGSIPVKKEHFESCRAAVCHEIGIREQEIPVWPDIAGVLETPQ